MSGLIRVKHQKLLETSQIFIWTRNYFPKDGERYPNHY